MKTATKTIDYQVQLFRSPVMGWIPAYYQPGTELGYIQHDVWYTDAGEADRDAQRLREHLKPRIDPNAKVRTVRRVTTIETIEER